MSAKYPAQPMHDNPDRKKLPKKYLRSLSMRNTSLFVGTIPEDHCRSISRWIYLIKRLYKEPIRATWYDQRDWWVKKCYVYKD